MRRSLEKIGGIWIWEVAWVVDDPPSDREREGPPRLEVQNPYGAIRIAIENTGELQIRSSMASRAVAPEDVAVERAGATATYRVVAQPSDEQPIDLDIVAPYGLVVQAATTDGDIEYVGYGKAVFQTDHGAVSLSFPGEATNFELLALEEPGYFEGQARVQKSGNVWSARDQLPEWRLAYGRLTLRAERPRSITLRELPIPDDSPVREHWQAAETLERTFRRFGRSGLRRREAERANTDTESTGSDFSADVRLVQLDVSVTDEAGRPVLGLGPDDFDVVEDGAPQRLMDVSSGEAPFNLILLLDCSSSTEQDRPAIEQAARRFIDVAREGDKIGVYALADTHFQILSRLTSDHDDAKASVAGIERFGGATPLYDAIILAYAEELAGLPRERNALVLLTDGLDNEIYGQQDTGKWGPQPALSQKRAAGGAPSAVTFDRLRKAAEEMRALIYPIILDPLAAIAKTEPQWYEKVRGWAITVHERSGALAAGTGGRVFPAHSLADLDEVYDQVVQELRSIYTVTYRPATQDFDGEWRRVRVKTSRRNVAVRSRSGYYAH